MKIKILVIIALAGISSIACKKNIGEIYAQQQNIEIQEIPELDISCRNLTTSIDGHFVIRNKEEYHNSFKNNSPHPDCSNYSLPEIDFDKYTLIGVVKSLGGCEWPDYDYNFYKKDGIYFMDVHIIEYGWCYMQTWVEEWYLVPKLSEDENVIFNISVETVPGINIHRNNE